MLDIIHAIAGVALSMLIVFVFVVLAEVMVDLSICLFYKINDRIEEHRCGKDDEEM